MKILIDIPTDQYNEIVYVNYERLRDIVRDGVVIEKCEDTIGRKAVDKIINKWLSHPDYELKDNIYDMTKKIHKLSSVTPRTNLAETSQDCISREQAIKQCGFGMTSLLIADNLRRLPSVTPQRPKGKWIHPYKSDIACECSECHIQMPITNYYHYCPNCGAEMSGGDSE